MSRSFKPYLFVAFLNAFSDLGHKIIIQNILFKVYDASEQIIYVSIINALMLLPFILVFSPSGFIATRFAKNTIMKYSAFFAIVITIFITFSYYNGWFEVAFAMTFMMALQSAIYSPAKYGYIKELVGLKYISSANGYIQATTTTAILLGIIVYTLLFESIIGDSFYTKEQMLIAIAPLGWFLVLGSILEFYLATKLPDTKALISTRKFSFARYIKLEYLRKNLIAIWRKQEIFDAIVALSLFWSISQVVLAIFGEYVKSNLGITNTIFVQGVLALSVIGIAVGSILSARFSKFYINTGLSVVGAFALMVLLLVIPFSTSSYLLAVEFILFGLFSGFIIVPLSAKIQELSPDAHFGVILAGNNFIQTIFMFSFLALSTIFAYFGADARVLFFIMFLVALLLFYRLFKRYFIGAFWVTCELILSTRYRVVYKNIPNESSMLLVGNHVSWLDWYLLQLPFKNRIGYLIDRAIYNKKPLKNIFKLASLIPISQGSSKESFKEATKRLKNGKIVAIFAEGEISRDCEIKEFKSGYNFIDTSASKIVPFYIDGMSGSIFSRCNTLKKRLFRREVTISFGEPIGCKIKPDELKNIITRMRD